MATLGTLGQMMLALPPQMAQYDPQQVALTQQRLQAGRLDQQTALLQLEDLRRQQASEAQRRQFFMANPGYLLGEGGGPQSTIGTLNAGGPGAITQTPMPGMPGQAQTVPASPDASRYAGVAPSSGGPLAEGVGMPTVTPPQSTIGGLGQPPRPDPVRDLMRRDPDAALKVLDMQWKMQDQALTRREKILGYIARQAQAVRSQADLEAMRADVQRFDPQAAAALPQVYSQEAMQPFIERGQTLLENAQTAKARADAAHTQQQTLTEQYTRETFLPELLQPPPATGGEPSPAAPAPGTPTPTRAQAAPAEVETAVQEAVRQYPRVRPEIARAIIAQESHFAQKVVSPKGAQGYMQLMPATQREMGVKDPFDTRQNILGGVGYFDKLLTRYNGAEATALAAYNAGPGRVDAAGGDLTKLPKETQDFVPSVLKRAEVGATARGPATAPGVQHLNQRLAHLERQAMAAAALGNTALAGALSQQAERLSKERDKLEEPQRAATREQALYELKQRQQAGPMLPEARRAFFTTLRNDIRQEPTFKTYQGVRNGYQSVLAGAEAQNAAGDLAMVNGYARILNPDSTVMQGEARTVEEAQGRLEVWLNSAQKFFEGDRLTAEGRQRLLELAHTLAQRKTQTADKELRQVYEPFAKEGGFDFQQLVPIEEFPAPTRGTPPAASGAGTGTGGRSNLDKFRDVLK